MSKAIKLQDNTYIDSSSIVHNRTPLTELLNKKIDILWSGNQNSGNITLSDSISNYDFILVGSQAYNANGYWNKGSILIPASDIAYTTDQRNNYNIAIVQSSSVYAEIQFRFENNKKIVIVSTHNSGWSSTYFKYVIGIKL